MAMPFLSYVQDDHRETELMMYFPLMTTSPAFIHSNDTYLDNAQFRDVSTKAIYVEASQMNPDPNWDGVEREWTEGITELSSRFVRGEVGKEVVDLNAGAIDMPMINGAPDKSKIIKEIAVLRSNLSEGLLRWQEVTRIVNGSIQEAYLYDYFVENGNYYRYALQPITADGRKGPITEFFDTVSTYEGFWMLGEQDMQFSFIYDGNISTITHNKSEAVIETITGRYPFVVSSADLDYRSFNFTGKLTYQQDVHRLLVSDTYSEAISPDPTIPINFVEIKYGDEAALNKKADISLLDESMVMQRIWRQKILEWLKDGKPKILKSEAEGNILVRVTNVTVTPVQSLYGLIADFSCTMTEIGDVKEKTLQRYSLRKETITKSELLKEKL